MKGNISSKKKIIIAASIVGVVLLAAVVSVVAVLAAATQTVQSTINVTYQVQDVAAKLGARYYVPVRETGGAETLEEVPAANYNEKIDTDNDGVLDADGPLAVITPDMDELDQLFTFDLKGKAIELTSKGKYIVFEFSFYNNSDTKDFTIALNDVPATTDTSNMRFYYSIVRTADGETQYDAAKFADAGNYTAITDDGVVLVDAEALTGLKGALSQEGANAADLIVTPGQTVYVYIKAEINNTNKGAYLGQSNTGFNWALSAA